MHALVLVNILLMPCCCCCLVPLGSSSHIGFKAKGVYYSWGAKPILQWQEPDFCLSTIDGSDIYLHLLNFDMFLKGREVFSRDNTYSELLTTDHRFNAFELLYVIQFYYNTLHIENGVHRTNGSFSGIYKVFPMYYAL